MPRFLFKALASNGQVKTGALTAANRDEVEMKLKADGLVPLEMRERRFRLPMEKLSLTPFARSASIQEVIFFTREMATLVGAGLPLDRALGVLSSQGDRPMNTVAQDILKSISGGKSLSEALEEHPDVFTQLYVGMIGSGEAGGDVKTALQRLYEMLDKQEKTASKVRSAMTYPIIVLVLTGLSLVVMLCLVVPQFKPMFERSADTLPMSTRIVLASSDFILAYGLVSGGGLLLLLLIVLRLRLPKRFKASIDRFLLGLPLFGPMLRALEVSRFCRVLGTLRLNGLTLVEAMTVAEGTIRSSVIAGAVRHAHGQMSQGDGLAAPLANLSVFPSIAIEMISVGEESGKLDEMLLQAADVLDEDADRKIQSLLSLLVPLVTVLLGAIVAVVIGSILSAIMGTYRLTL